MLMTMDGKSLFFFPPLNGADPTLQEIGDVFPGVEAIVFRRLDCRRSVLIFVNRRSGLKSCAREARECQRFYPRLPPSSNQRRRRAPKYATESLALHDAWNFPVAALG
jgi:hypothetical protein